MLKGFIHTYFLPYWLQGSIILIILGFLLLVVINEKENPKGRKVQQRSDFGLEAFMILVIGGLWPFAIPTLGLMLVIFGIFYFGSKFLDILTFLVRTEKPKLNIFRDNSFKNKKPYPKIFGVRKHD